MRREGSSLVEEAILQAPDEAETGALYFGMATAVSGDVIVVGDPSARVDGVASVGRVYVFRRSAASGLWFNESI